MAHSPSGTRHSRHALVERARDALVRASSPRVHASVIVALSGLAVPLAQVQEARVRCDRERLLLQAEEGFVHRVARPAISAVRREEP